MHYYLIYTAVVSHKTYKAVLKQFDVTVCVVCLPVICLSGKPTLSMTTRSVL